MICHECAREGLTTAAVSHCRLGATAVWCQARRGDHVPHAGSSRAGRVMATRMELPVLPELRLQVAPPDVADVAATAALMGDPIRAGIIAILGSGPHCVCEMAAALGERQNNVSNHLASCAGPALSAPAAIWSTHAGSTTSATTTPALQPCRRSNASSDDDDRRPASPRAVLAIRRAGGCRVVGRVVHHAPAGELGRLRPARPAAGLAARRCDRLLPVRRTQGPAAPDRDRDARLVPALVRVTGACPIGPGRPWRAAWNDGGGRLWGRHAVLLLLGGAAVHRLRRGRCPARRDVRVPHRLADGQRDRDRAAVGPVRARRDSALHRVWARHRGRGWPRHRPPSPGALCRAYVWEIKAGGARPSR